MARAVVVIVVGAVVVRGCGLVVADLVLVWRRVVILRLVIVFDDDFVVAFDFDFNDDFCIRMIVVERYICSANAGLVVTCIREKRGS